MSFVCWNCGQDLEQIPRPVSRHAQCPKCFEALHSCRMCRHHNPNVTGQCEDERADPPTRRESANFCEYYKPRFDAFINRRSHDADAAKLKLEALFGGGDELGSSATSSQVAPPSREDTAKAALEALFSPPQKK
jgi:hypothetical protein